MIYISFDQGEWMKGRSKNLFRVLFTLNEWEYLKNLVEIHFFLNFKLIVVTPIKGDKGLIRNFISGHIDLLNDLMNRSRIY